ncbi:OLC1v1033631C1 [Oldenlandia corymbosa var. corymbosa]|uniref:OLC1v1033631C1 n=1 Tax=Oldenlandia corymbosa var. corymbosa TaxID=529605 RepID=A0AAV1CPF7_OLDCO|nr:OLC1v1033631C1 [Oldenlandia corymbosa var. corymbosa]
MDPGHPHQHQYGSVHIHPADQNTMVGGGGMGAAAADRFPQWSIQETRDFLMIRAELDPTFMETKRNKLLWEVIANKMRERGYNRSAEQCKCKWKNLVTRYKGCETMEAADGMRQQFPFYNELQGIFAARMQRMLWLEAEGGGAAAASGSSNKKKAAAVATLSSSEEMDDQNEDMSEGERMLPISASSKKKRKIKGSGGGGGGSSSTSNTAVASSVKEVLDDFMKQQMQMEREWLKAYEAREEERRKREMEWRQTMEALENERLMMEKRWREREEQRRIREEARAEKRDALITALLNKLRKEDS